jgi:hypothetical protein
MGSSVMAFVPSFINIGSGIQKLKAEFVHRHKRHRCTGSMEIT